MLLPHSAQIRDIASRGQIPVVIFEPMPGMAEIFGGRGSCIRAMTREQRRSFEHGEDHSQRVWVRKQLPRGMVKLLGIIHFGTFLLNWVSGHELYVEPGSLDEEQGRSS
jgi:hypothetical protein